MKGSEREKKEKKYRGIAGGTIPRVSMTPSLAAGVVLGTTSGILCQKQ